MTKDIVVARNAYNSYELVSKKAVGFSVTRLPHLRAELPVPLLPSVLGITPHWTQCQRVS